MRDGERIVDELYDAIGKRLTSLKLPDLPKLGAGSEGPAAELAGAFTPAANQIRSTIQGALGPLGPTLAKAAVQIEAMAGSVLATNRRLDSEVRYPAFMNATTKLRGFVQGQFDSLDGRPLQFAKLADKALGGIQIGAKLKNGLGAFTSLNGNAARELARLKAPNINFSPATLGVQAVQGAAEKATTSFRGLGLQIAGALGFVGVGYKLVGFLKQGIVNASDLNEAINKTNVLLGDASPAVRQFADSMAKDFGTSKAASLEVSTQIAGIGKGLGKLDGKSLSDFSVNLTKLAADVGSIDNKSLRDIGDAFRIALTGEQSDVIKGLGVVINETTTKTFALSHGIAKVGTELTEQQKVLARAGQLTEGLAFANGDLARTINDPANAYRKFTGQIENLGATLGTTFLPVVNEVLATLNGLATTTDASLGQSKTAFQAWAESAAASVSSVNLYLNNWDDTIQLATLSAQQGLLGFSNRVEDYFGGIAATVAYAIAHPFEALRAEIDIAWGQIKNLATNLREVLAHGFDAKFIDINQGVGSRKANPQAPRLAADFTQEMAEIANRIEARRVAKPPAPSAPADRPNPAVAEFNAKAQSELASFAKSFKEKVRTPLEEYGDLMKKATESLKAGLITPAEFQKADRFARKESGIEGGAKFAGALELGSREAYSATLHAMRGGDTSDIPRLTLDNARRQLNQLEKLNKNLGARQDVVVPERMIV